MPVFSGEFGDIRIRIGAVTYLNTRPLTFCLKELAPRAEIVVDLPSRLADMLVGGALDVAIVPSIEYARTPGSTIVSDACVSSDGPVRSVKFYSRVPVERIRTLALDEGSRTSAVLTRILLKEQYGLSPALETLPIGASPEETSADALVLIGDRGLVSPPGEFAVEWDLGERWRRWTGLPFVFALWLGRPGADLEGVDRLLAAARDRGVDRFEEIARLAAPEIGLDQSECLAYLRDHLGFALGPRQRHGLSRFFELARRYGLL